MSCPCFAKEVRYLVHAPTCSPPMHGTWEEENSAVRTPLMTGHHAARLQQMKACFGQGSLEYVNMWAVDMG